MIDLGNATLLIRLVTREVLFLRTFYNRATRQQGAVIHSLLFFLKSSPFFLGNGNENVEEDLYLYPFFLFRLFTGRPRRFVPLILTEFSLKSFVLLRVLGYFCVGEFY